MEVDDLKCWHEKRRWRPLLGRRHRKAVECLDNAAKNTKKLKRDLERARRALVQIENSGRGDRPYHWTAVEAVTAATTALDEIGRGTAD